VEEVSVTPQHYNRQQLYNGMDSFESHLENQTKGKINYENNTISLGNNLSAAWTTAVGKQNVRSNLREIAKTRHRYLHNLEEDLDIAACFKIMEETSTLLV
jgi:hypothetical protein